MTLVVSITGSGGAWAPDRWHERFRSALGAKHRVVLDGVESYAPDVVSYAAVWKPPAGFLATLPNLKVIFNLGAGVDALLADPTLPRVPVVRVVNGDLTARMTEYIVLHVLLHHRRLPVTLRAQANRHWLTQDQWAARDLRVGILGLGELGRDAADVLRRLGFDVAGWSRAGHPVEGIEVFAGTGQMGAFLSRTDILVALLPLTAATRGILNRHLFGRLARNGRLGAPVLINAGRGGLQVEADILDALDDGTLAAASLDVFETEPLPAASRLWSHPNVIVTPHNAADSDPDVIAADVARQIIDFERDGQLRNVVDVALGY